MPIFAHGDTRFAHLAPLKFTNFRDLSSLDEYLDVLVNSVMLNLSVGWIQGSSTSLRGGLGSLRMEHPTLLGTLSQNVATTIP